jgi:diguanylate cyclase
MPRALVNYILCFLAGTLAAFAGLFASANLSARPGAFSLPSFAEVVAAIDPVVACAVLVVIAFAVLAYYWRQGEADGLSAAGLAAAVGAAKPSAAANPSSDPREVSAVRDELERQLGRLIVILAGQLENSREQVASLKDTNASLASVSTVAELREVVGALIAKNEASSRQTRDLEARLKEAQDQARTLRQRLTQAEKLASLDPLTSVANRRCFERFISAEVDRSHQDGTPLCLIMTDIDHFKKVNDTYGHAAGDRVLKSFAELLSKNMRDGDLVARFGGEEFAIVLPQTPMGDAYGIAERIRSVFERQGGADAKVTNEFGRLTASFGVAEIREGEPPSALIHRADQKLYEAKSEGRNCTMVWSSSVTAGERQTQAG